MSAQAYPDAVSLRADLEMLQQSLQAESRLGGGSGGALARLSRAVETFGFHLAALDLRQNSDVHERVVAELLMVAGVATVGGNIEAYAEVCEAVCEEAYERMVADAAAIAADAVIAMCECDRVRHRRYGSAGLWDRRQTGLKYSCSD